MVPSGSFSRPLHERDSRQTTVVLSANVRHLDDIDGIWSPLKKRYICVHGNGPAEYFFPRQILYLICYLSLLPEEEDKQSLGN